MLKTFRENFKQLKWVLWIVIAIFVVFVFVDWGMGTAGAGRDTDLAAQVGSHRITVGEFQREYRDTEDRYRQLYGPSFSPELVKALDLPKTVLENLISRQLFHVEAARLGLGVTDEELKARILGMKDSQGRPLFLKDGAFVGEQAYRRVLASIRVTAAEFEQQTREQLLLEKLNRYLTETVFVSDEELRDDFAARTVKAKMSYVLLPAAPGTAPTVSDAEAEAYFRENPGAYLQPEKRKAKYLLVETAKVRQTVTVTDAEVANEYNSNLDAYKKKEEVKARHVLYKTDGTPASEAAARAKAEAAKKKLDAGADFAALAKAESEDTGSKASGGDLGFFERGRMVKEFEDAAFSAEPNAIVGPVKSAFGFHVIQVLEKRSERIQPLFDVAAAIKARLQDERAADETKRMARDVADRLAREGGKPSDDQLRAMTGPLVTFNETEFVGKSDAPAGIGFNPAFSQALFSLSLNEVSDPVSTARGEAIVKLVDVKKPGMPAFADVKARVTGDLVKKKQDDATLSALRAAMTPGATLESVAAAVGAKVETADSFGKNGPVGTLGSPKALLDAAFAAEPGAVKGPLLVPDRGAVAFQLLEKTAFDQAAFEAQREEIRDRLKNQKSGRLLQAMVARKRAETKITVNKELLARFGGRD
ncbi:MAG: hypothetical protein EDX89_20135 [Acidobacteria bacterium]|nr:MAG: hypothetical protein EDX89_20135 [Acidobacteriota bacterium]MCE7958683.1 hypothetical protein [Acidobacteria bacterium ACB2]